MHFQGFQKFRTPRITVDSKCSTLVSVVALQGTFALSSDLTNGWLCSVAGIHFAALFFVDGSLAEAGGSTSGSVLVPSW